MTRRTPTSTFHHSPSNPRLTSSPACISPFAPGARSSWAAERKTGRLCDSTGNEASAAIQNRIDA